MNGIFQRNESVVAAGAPTLGNGFGSIDDVAFVMMVIRLQSLDDDIATKIENLTAQNEVRKAYQNRINALRTAQGGKTGDDDVDLPGDLSTRYDYRWDSETNGLQTVDRGYYDEDDHDVANASTVQSEIDRLQGEIDEINGDSELAMMELNRAVNQRQTALQLTTNILSSVHQSQMGIIGNIGK